MARPLRGLEVTRRYARRRHRTWMLSMTLASLGWGCWWAALFVAKYTSIVPDWRWVEVAAALFAAPGLVVALLTVRAQRTWLFFAAVPILANAGLLVLPVVLPDNLFGPR
jgi:hypothetical protein